MPPSHSSSSTPLYMIIGAALASLFSLTKVIQTRRRLQQQRNIPVSLVEAVIHSLFDAVDTVNHQANQIAMIMDERMNQPSTIPMLQLQHHQPMKMLTSSGDAAINMKSILPPSESSSRSGAMMNQQVKKNEIPLLINQPLSSLSSPPLVLNNKNTRTSTSSSSSSGSGGAVNKLSDPMLASIPNNSFK